MKQLSERDYYILKKILRYCLEIQDDIQFFGDNFSVFLENHSYRNSSAMCLLQIGELSNHLTEDFRKTYADIPWRDIRAMRNIVAHAYGELNLESAWETMHRDISELRDFCEGILGDMT